MNFSESDLFNEVQSVIDASDQVIEIDWLAGYVMANHADVHGADKDFYILCAWAHVKTTVRAVVRRYRPEVNEEPDRQIILPGFERLQTKYHIERNKKSCLVPIEQMTEAELDVKIVEYRRMAEGCRLHAEELLRYKVTRNTARPSLAIVSNRSIQDSANIHPTL